jgi:SAM-dependent methyltransferase
MAKQGEIEYLSNIGEAGIRHAVGKPFSDPGCPNYLMEMGALFHLLPQPPARLLDLGCGTGWTSLFFARRGFDVVGVDIAADMIEQANLCRDREELDNLRFVVSDYEEMGFEDEFDAATFIDSLHHSIDEELTLRMVYKALKPGGVCVTSEPGRGHANAPASLEAVKKYGVTERDMPPETIIAAGRRVGFRKFTVYPHASLMGKYTYNYPGRRFNWWAARGGLFRRLGTGAFLLYQALFHLDRTGIVVLVK